MLIRIRKEEIGDTYTLPAMLWCFFYYVVRRGTTMHLLCIALLFHVLVGVVLVVVLGLVLAGLVMTVSFLIRSLQPLIFLMLTDLLLLSSSIR